MINKKMKITTKICLSIVMILLSQVLSTNSKIERTVKSNTKDLEEQHVDPFGATDTKFLLLGDTGQVDTYFRDFLLRKMLSNVAEIKPLTSGKFDNFQRIMEPLNKSKPKYHQGIILGDFLYTENKGGNVSLSKIEDTTNVKEPGFKRSLFYETDGKKVEVTAVFEDRLQKSTAALKTLLKTYTDTTSFWLLLNGNHSYDVDAAAEKTYMNENKSTVRIYKNSKVHISKDVCFLDLNYGDLACLNSTYAKCFKGGLMMARYGKDEAETLNSLAKLIETTLTGTLCRDQWRVVRTHAAAFNSEIDAGVLHQEFKGIVKCKLRITAQEIEKNLNKDLLELKDFKALSEVLNILEKSKFKLTAPILEKNSPGVTKNKAKIVNRLFTCTVEEPTKGSGFSVMQLVNKAKPHFTLGSHLHASQVLFAQKSNSFRNIDWKSASNLKTTPITGCWEINNIPDFKFKSQMDYTLKNCPKAATTTKFTIKDNPDYDILFIIGNSGRFLDPFVDGKNTVSHIVWQRINSGVKGLAFDISNKKNAILGDVEDALKADLNTAYGFVEFITTSNTAAVVEFKEYDPTSKSIISVLKVELAKGSTSVPNYTVSNLPSKPNRKLK